MSLTAKVNSSRLEQWPFSWGTSTNWEELSCGGCYSHFIENFLRLLGQAIYLFIYLLTHSISLSSPEIEERLERLQSPSSPRSKGSN